MPRGPGSHGESRQLALHHILTFYTPETPAGGPPNTRVDFVLNNVFGLDTSVGGAPDLENGDYKRGSDPKVIQTWSINDEGEELFARLCRMADNV